MRPSGDADGAEQIVPIAAAKTQPAFMLLIVGPTVSNGVEDFYSPATVAILDQLIASESRTRTSSSLEPATTFRRAGPTSISGWQRPFSNA